MRRLVVLRGAPGSGKSTFLRNTSCFFDQAINFQDTKAVCSADDYFVGPDGVYRWDRSKLKDAHKTCYDLCENLMRNRVGTIYLDNTNVTFRDMRGYLDLARKYRYQVEFVIMDDTFKLSAEELAMRNVHNVPVETIQRMKDNFEPNPIFCSQCKRWRSGKEIDHTCGSTDDNPQPKPDKNQL